MEEWREPGGNEKDSKNAKKNIYILKNQIRIKYFSSKFVVI